MLSSALLLAACSDGRTAATTLPSTSVGGGTVTPTTVAVPSTSSSTTEAPTTAAPADPSHDDIPVGTCDTIAPGAIGFRNETGHVADQYRRIGTSTQGRPIWAEHWGPADGAQVLVLGQVHGDECAPAWFVQAIRERPPTTFGIWLVPTVNPDGLAAHTRRTASDVDPNRDGFTLVTPEAQAVMSFTQVVQPVLTVHVHSPYRTIGAHNGGLALEVATAMSTAAGWGYPSNAGRVQKDDQAFLWEGQERVIPGEPSVLIELPAVAEAESPAPPQPQRKVVTSVTDVAATATLLRDALYTVMAAH